MNDTETKSGVHTVLTRSYLSLPPGRTARSEAAPTVGSVYEVGSRARDRSERLLQHRADRRLPMGRQASPQEEASDEEYAARG